jgi:FkbM family methyltransferase
MSSFFLLYARYRYIAYRLFLRIKMGKKRRDEYLQGKGISMIDFLPNFLPERPYSMNGIKAIPRKGTHDFYLLFTPREQEIKTHLTMYENETFVDVGASVGPYSLKIANDYKNKGVRVIAIEAHSSCYNALSRNIECNNFSHIKTVNKAILDYKGVMTMYEHRDRNRDRSASYTSIQSTLDSNSLDERSFSVECDTLDNILASHKVDVMKIDIEGAEVLALKGATNTLKKLRKVIVEIHGDNFDKVKQILVTHNFKLEVIRTAGQIKYVIGSK